MLYIIYIYIIKSSLRRTVAAEGSARREQRLETCRFERVNAYYNINYKDVFSFLRPDTEVSKE